MTENPRAPADSPCELLQRIEDSMSRVGKMASEHRGPRMSIPVDPIRDDDVFICDTLRMLRDYVKADAPPVLSARPNEAEDWLDVSVFAKDALETISDPECAVGYLRNILAICDERRKPKNEADAPRGQAVARPFAYYNAKYGTVFVSRAGDPPEAQSGAMESGELVPLYLAPPPSPVGEDAPALQAGGVREKYRAITFDDIRNMVDAWRQNNGTGLDSLTAAFNYAKSIGAVVPQEGK